MFDQPYNNSLFEADEDQEYKMQRQHLLDLTHVYKDSITNYETFFEGKKVCAVGMPIDEKKFIHDDLKIFGVKVYYNWTYDLSSFDPTILIIGDKSNNYLQDVSKRQEEGFDITVITIDHLYSEINAFYKSDEGKSFIEKYKEEQLQKQEEKERKKQIALSKIANDDYLSTLSLCDASGLSIADDVFHVIGNIPKIEEDEEDFSCLYAYPTNSKEVYELIRKKGGNTNTKETGNISCIVFGDKSPIRVFETFKSKVKFIPYKDFIKWLQSQKTLEKDDYFKNIKLADDGFTKQVQDVNPNELSPFKDVFQIVGTLFETNEDFNEDNYTPRDILYYNIQEKGGYIDKNNEGKATCIIYGYLPPKDAFERRGVKYISYRKFYSWLNSQPKRDPGCYAIKDYYQVSVDSRLRTYQQNLKNEIFEKWSVHFNVMLQLPTGTGKTVLFTSIINDLTQVAGTKILIIAHRTELIDQIDSWLNKYGIEHGIIQSSRPRQLQKNIQIASIQTITNKHNQEVMDQFKADFIIIDEAHHALAESYQLLWNKYPGTWKLGVTATPYRLNHTSFTDLFSELIVSQPMSQFIHEGYLADYIYLADNPNGDMLREIDSIKEKSSTGDYKVRTLMDNLNVDKYIKYIVSCYLQYAKGKRGIVYAITVEHGKNLCQAYQCIGVKAEFIDSTTPKKERAKIIERFRRGEIDIMVNVNIFSEGLDIPAIEFIQMTRPTYSLSMYLQQVGRGLRPTKGNGKCIILDNAGMFEKFGLPSDHRNWSIHFEGIYTNQDADTDRSENRARLFKLSKGDDDAMIQLNGEKDRPSIRKIFAKDNMPEATTSVPKLSSAKPGKTTCKDLDKLPSRKPIVQEAISKKRVEELKEALEDNRRLKKKYGYRIGGRPNNEAEANKHKSKYDIIDIIIWVVAILIVLGVIVFGLGALALGGFFLAAGIIGKQRR